MQFDFSRPMLDLHGTPIQNAGKSVTFRSVAEQLVLADGQSATGDGKLARFKLALKISAGDPVELSVDEMKLLQDQVREFGAAITVGRFDEFLNGK